MKRKAISILTFDTLDNPFAAYPRFLTRGKRISAITAISYEGLLAVELEVNSYKFMDFIRGTLIPEMQPFDGSNCKSIPITDNCSIHHVCLSNNSCRMLVFFSCSSHPIAPT